MRLIDADVIKDYYKKERAKVKGPLTPFEIEKCLSDAIDLCPTNDPVKHGHWTLLYKGEKSSDYECSACLGILSDVENDDERDLVSYCPMCGAKMDEPVIDCHD